MSRAALLAGGLLLATLVVWQLPARRSGFVPPDASVTATLTGSESRIPGASGERIAVAARGGDPNPVHSLLNIRSAMRYGEYEWKDDDVPDGPLWVRIDLRQQLMSVFRGGHEIGTSVILYGADKKPTPIGTFPILARFKDHRSGPYDAPMPYTLRLTPDGVSIHGSNVRWGAATHGCVGVPLKFAEKLFDQVKVGDNVTITDDAPPRTHA